MPQQGGRMAAAARKAKVMMVVRQDGFHGIAGPRALTDAQRMRTQDAVGGVFGCGSDPDFPQTLTVPCQVSDSCCCLF